MGEEAGPAGADLANQEHDGTGREREGFDRIAFGQGLHLRRPGPVAADDAADHALVREAAHPALAAGTDAERVDDGEVLGVAGREEAGLDAFQHRVGLDQPAARARDRDGVAVVDPGRLVGRRLESRAHPLP